MMDWHKQASMLADMAEAALDNAYAERGNVPRNKMEAWLSLAASYHVTFIDEIDGGIAFLDIEDLRTQEDTLNHYPGEHEAQLLSELVARFQQISRRYDVIRDLLSASKAFPRTEINWAIAS